MILTIWIALLLFSFILLFAGKFIDAPPLALGGSLFIFLLGLVLMSGSVVIESGEVKGYNYVCGCCENNTFNIGQELTASCSGIEPPCTDFISQPLCESVGCTWNASSECEGSINLCEDYTSSATCLRYDYCDWNITTSVCPNSTLPVVHNETIVKQYDSFDNEILLGLTINHIIGFWLSVLGVFSFIIVITNLKTDDQLKEDAFRRYR